MIFERQNSLDCWLISIENLSTRPSPAEWFYLLCSFGPESDVFPFCLFAGSSRHSVTSVIVSLFFCFICGIPTFLYYYYYSGMFFFLTFLFSGELSLCCFKIRWVSQFLWPFVFLLFTPVSLYRDSDLLLCFIYILSFGYCFALVSFFFFFF